MLKLINVTKEYSLGKNEKVQVLKGVNLEIKQGEFVAIIGPSGSGKSTLMNIIGLLDQPSSGEYFLGDVRVGHLKDDAQADIRGRKIGFIFQNYSLLPRMGSLQQIMVPLEYQGITGGRARTLALEHLRKVGLESKAKSRPNEMSGGQCQRVAIARALSTNPDIILADEPTGALDSKTGDEILELFRLINKEGKTVIMITHDTSIASRADRIIHIRDGEIYN